MVHFDKAYGTFADAVKHRDGLAVIGLLFKATDKIPADPKFKLLSVRFHYIIPIPFPFHFLNFFSLLSILSGLSQI
jgi:hypothetical protein